MFKNIKLLRLEIFSMAFLLIALFGFQLVAQTPNQNQVVKNFADGDYAAFKFDDRKKVVAGGKAWGVKFTKDSKQDGGGNTIITELVLNRAGIIEETYKPDLANHPAYFTGEGIRVQFFDGKLFYYAWKSAAAEIKYILVPNGGSVSGTHDEWKSKIEANQSTVLADQKNAREAIVSQKQASENAEKLANSIKGKTVKKLTVKWITPPTSLGHLSKVKYGIEAELIDGKILKTSNLGGKMPWDDFNINVEGAEFGEEEVIVWLDVNKVPNDKILITATAKHDANIKATANLDLPYSMAVKLNYSGGEGGRVNIYAYAGYKGSDGKNLIINATAGKTLSGKNIIKVEVQDGGTGEILNKLKIAAGTALSINVSGGEGSYGNNDTRGGNGGNGGNVTLNQDPSASGLAISVVNNGGTSGKHKERPSLNGTVGNNGRYQVNKQAVSLDW